MNIKYYDINEVLAKNANDANSFKDYITNSATKTYIDKIDNAYNKIKPYIDNLPKENQDIIIWNFNKYSFKLANWYNKYYKNEASYPSILISGGAKFSIKKKEIQNENRSKLFKEFEYLENKLNNIINITSRNILNSNDPNILELLELKIEKLQTQHENMKYINNFYRKHGTLINCIDINGDLMKETTANFITKKLKDTYHNIPYPQYALTNSLANIKRLNNRLESIKRDKEIARSSNDTIVLNGLFKVIEDADNMRLKLIFNDKPNEDTRTILKKNGFKWSPNSGAWQRLLNDNSRYALNRVINALS